MPVRITQRTASFNRNCDLLGMVTTDRRTNLLWPIAGQFDRAGADSQRLGNALPAVKVVATPGPLARLTDQRGSKRVGLYITQYPQIMAASLERETLICPFIDVPHAGRGMSHMIG